MIHWLWILPAGFGIFLLWQVLSQFFERRVVFLTAFLVLFGTNLFWQAIFAGPSAHIFLFTLFLAMLWLTIQWQKTSHWLPLIAMLPVMILVSMLSAPGIWIILFPVFAVSNTPLPAGREGQGVGSFPAAEGPGVGSFPAAEGQVVGRLTLATTLIICILLRHFSWFSSPGADLYFGIPHGDQFPIVPANIHRVLFSLRNGWMVYTPLVIPAISGFYLLAEKNRAVYYAAFLIILVSLVFAGSIPRWWYNDSFGYPNLVEAYAVLSIPLGYVVQWIWQRRRITRIFLVTAAGLLVLLNLFQTWQFGRSIIVPEKMTGKYYLAAFGRTSALPSNTGLTGSPGPALNDTIPGNMPVTCTKVNSFDFEQAGNDWDAHRSGRYAHSGRFSLRMSPEFSFSPGMIVPVRQLTSTDSSWIRATAHFFYTCKPAENILFLVITCLHDGVPYKYRAARMMDERFRPWCWNTVTMSYLLPLPAYPDDAVNVYFWNFGQNECYIDDFRIDLCKPVRP